MSMPGFTARNSLGRTMTGYRVNSIHGLERPRGTVAPQLPASGGCGDCTSLRWPDGRPTGACARACCDTLGRCWTETCSCGGGAVRGGGLFGIGSSQVFTL